MGCSVFAQDASIGLVDQDGGDKLLVRAQEAEGQEVGAGSDQGGHTPGESNGGLAGEAPQRLRRRLRRRRRWRQWETRYEYAFSRPSVLIGSRTVCPYTREASSGVVCCCTRGFF